ncbi:hypothetical protein ACQ86N_14840 [Puia sp. P3]|uniref:hypothetical protein n=1 Tax=Puia sp. P3 TaxID=3423952 RepID=UPI003D67D77F
MKTEQAEDRRLYREMAETASVNDRRDAGLAWYPIAIKDEEIGRGDYLTVEVERTTNQDVAHQLRFGASAVLFPIMMRSTTGWKGLSLFRAATGSN